MKKKFLTILLAAAVAAALYGCSSDDGADGQTQAATQAETQSAASEETESETEEETEAAYEQGTVTDTGYQSAWLNIQFTASADDVMATQEEIDSLLESGSEVIEENTGVDTSASATTTVTEMMVSRVDGVPSIQLMVEQLPMANMTEDQYLTSVQAQLEAVDMGYAFDDSFGTRQIAGQDYKVLSAEATYNGVDMIQEYAVRKQGDRMVAFVMTCTPDTQEDAENLYGQFTAIQ